MTIKAPPHFFTRRMYFPRTRSEYAFILDLFESQYPIRYEIAPPIYESTPRIARKIKGDSNFVVQITKRSGGIIPRKDSEAKNIIKIKPSENLLKINWKIGLKSIKYFPINIIGTIIAIYIMTIFNAVHHIYPYNPLLMLLR